MRGARRRPALIAALTIDDGEELARRDGVHGGDLAPVDRGVEAGLARAEALQAGAQDQDPRGYADPGVESLLSGGAARLAVAELAADARSVHRLLHGVKDVERISIRDHHRAALCEALHPVVLGEAVPRDEEPLRGAEPLLERRAGAKGFPLRREPR
jgi:hypothetical protein